MAKQSFEQNMQELEETVKKMESEDVSLDEALSLFEKGIKLSKSCQKILEDAEKKVNVLLKSEDGTLSEKPFETKEE